MVRATHHARERRHRLWEIGIAEARQRGLLVLTHHSVAAEAGSAFAGLTDLVADGDGAPPEPPRDRARGPGRSGARSARRPATARRIIRVGAPAALRRLRIEPSWR